MLVERRVSAYFFLGKMFISVTIGIGISPIFASNAQQGTAPTPPAPVWILATGFWNDDGVWDDNAVWID